MLLGWELIADVLEGISSLSPTGVRLLIVSLFSLSGVAGSTGVASLPSHRATVCHRHDRLSTGVVMGLEWRDYQCRQVFFAPLQVTGEWEVVSGGKLS